MNRRLCLSIFVTSCFFSSFAFANVQNYLGSQSAGMGNSGRAAVLPTSSHFLNPAAVAHFSSFNVAGGYQRDNNDRRGRGDTWAVQFAESSPETMFAGSFSALQHEREIPGLPSSKAYDFQLNLAGIIYPGFAVGVGGRRLQETTNTGSRFIQNNANIGTLYTPTENLGIALVGYNLVPAEDGVPVHLRLSRAYAAGINYNLGSSVRLRADILRQEDQNPDQKYSYGGGFENFFFPEFCVRLGYANDERIDQKLYTGGFGWDGPKFRVNYAVQIEDGQAGQRHSFDLWLVF